MSALRTAHAALRMDNERKLRAGSDARGRRAGGRHAATPQVRSEPEMWNAANPQDVRCSSEGLWSVYTLSGWSSEIPTYLNKSIRYAELKICI